MKTVVSRCPVCGKELVAVRLRCENCETVIENSFRLSRFDYLTDDELRFVETFLRCRGNIKEVERALGISYPTVRARLDGILKRLGLFAAGEEEKLRADRKEQVLAALERGEITPEQAVEQLK